MTRIATILETLVYLPFTHLTQLLAPEYFIAQRRYLKTLWNARFEVLTVMLLKIQSFTDVTLHHWVNSPQSFKES
jgi:hypothetical protein